ncbi:MAG: bifunctional precorrin-2 dehydrogenase/sirohydrochlorin ferrochelatase [Spirochaetaceae bacterium]|jgi:siroheme synthase-like protein|nr:bifunctional precorrin-2 dehydrogenase/sirohydrochlorin ferrochelatase [Spirochaetaceae bacterium]
MEPNGKKGEENSGRGTKPEKNTPAARFLFPLFLDISGKKVLVIGGGAVALRRVRKLLPFRCRIEILSPAICGELHRLAGAFPGVITLTEGRFRAGASAGADFVIAASDSRTANHAAAEECGKNRIPVSVADRAEESDFFFPALVMEDDLVIGVVSSTGDHKKVKYAREKISGVFKK